MQQLADPDGHADRTNVRHERKRKTTSRRKVTVRLSEGVHARLDVATDRPGVGKSMFVEAALEHFLTPAPSVGDLVNERFGQMQARFDRLEHAIQTVTETVALHARYQLAVTPPVPEERQREAVLLGDDRFRIFAEQVDRRVRQYRPLLRETIDRINSEDDGQTAEATRKQAAHDPGAHENGQGDGAEDIEAAQRSQQAETDSHVYRDPASAAISRAGYRVTGKDRHSAGQRLRPGSTGGPDLHGKPPPSNWRLILAVFLPFAAGYYLSFLFRTINAAISPVLASEFGLDASKTGLMTSVYFLVLAGAQIPIGAFLDRYGPRRVQGVLLVVAAGGASLFGTASEFAELLMGRALIGLGVAASLMAGLKATLIWFRKERIALVNGCMIMLGSLGAVTATVPTDWMLEWVGWRSLFELLTLATVAVAAVVYFVVPERADSTIAVARSAPTTVWSVFSDPRFLKIAPLSASCIGSSWALQSLWAAPWLVDVEGLDRPSVIYRLFIMALGLSFGALLLGGLADRLRKRGISAEALLAAMGGLLIAAEVAIVLRVPLPSLLPWCIVSVMGAATVLSYTTIAEYFPQELAARANGALNLTHFGWAFAVQCGVGLVVEQWTPQGGHYPQIAYQVAFGLIAALQTAAMVWFAWPWFRRLLNRFTFGPLYAHHELALVPASINEAMLHPADEQEW